MKRSVIAAIFARGGSKGVLRKNLRLAAGRTLLERAISDARAARTIDHVIVSTDSEEIADVARKSGADVPFMRPSSLAADAAPEWESWQHAIREGRAHGWPFDILVSVPTTSPLRLPEHIDACVGRLIVSNADVALTVTPSARNPYFNMVTLRDGAARIVNAGHQSANRQMAPETFDITTIAYAARAEFVLAAGGLFEGRAVANVVPAEFALDIDTEFDLKIADLLLGVEGR